MQLNYHPLPLVMYATLCFAFLLFLHYLSGGGTSKTLPTNWPFVGMLPSFLLNLHRVQDWLTHFLSKNGRTFVLQGPWFANITSMLFTSDPANIRHIFNTHFSNYSKGSQFKENFDVLGDGMFNADGESWKTQRKELHQVFNEKRFHRFYQQLSYSKVEYGLLPVLEHVMNLDMVVDMQDFFKRYTFDATIMLFAGTDPSSLTVEFDRNPYLDAFDDIEEAILYRHVIPRSCWKLQRWLGIGREKKLSKAKECLYQFAAQCISAKRKVVPSERVRQNDKDCDVLTPFLEGDGLLGTKSDTFLRDGMLNFMLAGTGTVAVGLTWFFWLVLQNPRVETAIIEELKNRISTSFKEGKKFKVFDIEELKGLAYLHGAICETLRLFPPVPYEVRQPIKQGTLPSGHKVDSKTNIVVSIYGMARMEDIWGKDCLEFKPERWISEEGGIKQVPSHKFLAFLTGPRSCMGKEIALTQMKTVAATLLFNFNVELVESHAVTPKPSIILYMNPGMMARIKRRSS